jgi:hypothetical protein
VSWSCRAGLDQQHGLNLRVPSNANQIFHGSKVTGSGGQVVEEVGQALSAARRFIALDTGAAATLAHNPNPRRCWPSCRFIALDTGAAATLAPGLVAALWQPRVLAALKPHALDDAGAHSGPLLAGAAHLAHLPGAPAPHPFPNLRAGAAVTCCHQRHFFTCTNQKQWVWGMGNACDRKHTPVAAHTARVAAQRDAASSLGGPGT